MRSDVGTFRTAAGCKLRYGRPKGLRPIAKKFPLRLETACNPNRNTLASIRMRPQVPTNSPEAVEKEVRRIYSRLYPQGDVRFIFEAFRWAIECFTGQHSGYQAVDARYHDFEHTLQGTLCLVRLLSGRHAAGAEPCLDERTFRLGLLAILLHDTGYLKTNEDRAGTGAKYTITHVGRSADFAAQFLAEKGYEAANIQAVQNMIRCTGLNAKLATIPFESQAERITGYALATADLLGQMAADDYVEKLPVLYGEFAEAAAYSGDRTHFVASFKSAQDLVEKTPTFWERSIRSKLNTELQGLWRFLNDPYPDGPNEYLARIEANMERIRGQFRNAETAGARD